MKTLYEQYPSGVAGLSDLYPNVTEMLRYFSSAADMAVALGFIGGGSAVNHWLRLQNMPGQRTERFAKMWLETHRKPAVEGVAPKPDVPASSGVVLMVICPHGVSERAIKLLSVIGCEAVEI